MTITSLGRLNDQADSLSVAPTLSHKAYLALSRMIQERTLPAGRAIVETKLAEQLGVSRTPLRQALQRLESEGLLQKLETRSYVVRRVELREYLQSLRTREILEPEAAELAIGRISPDKITEVRATLHEVQKRVPYDMLAHWRSDDQVHNLYILACGNQVIQDILRSLRTTTKLFEIERLSERLKPDNSQHEEILGALERADVPETRAAIERHLRSLAEFAINVL